MPQKTIPTNLNYTICDSTFEGLESLFASIDKAYQMVARVFAFDCSGCVDNCCGTLFFHYTVLEFLYLREGFTGLDKADRQAVVRSSRAYIREFEGAGDPTGKRVMCPLNRGGRCILYGYRPMICRLHGVPYHLDVAARRSGHGLGCHRFISENPEPADGYLKIDRTVFYKEAARLEFDLRRQLRSSKKYKYTVAEVFKDLTP